MVPIAFGLTAQDLLRQQSLAPKRNEPFGVEIFWMYSPESHC